MTPNRYTSTGRLVKADRSLTEAQFQQQVADLAAHTGWKRYHTLRSKGSDAGWPDLVLCRPPELLFIELKTERGKPSDAQREWLQSLTLCRAEVYLWRPSDWPEIEARLQVRFVKPTEAHLTRGRELAKEHGW